MTFPASADAAESYYGKSGSELETVGSWQGKEAARLGIGGTSDLAAFSKLLHNRTPEGKKLTPRDSDRRRPMLDITVSPSKSVAVMIMFDPRIKAEVIAANRDMMELVERMAQTRVSMPARRMRRQEKVTTGSLLWMDFQHDITRSRDPGFHIHNAVIAVTTHNGRQYSPEFDNIVRSSAFLKAYFHNNLAGRMKKLGYEITPTKDAFELSCVPKRVLKEFSQRREDINAEAAKRVIKSPKGRAAIAAYTRQRKKDDLKADKLFEEWLKRLTPDESRRLGSATRKALEASQDEIALTPSVHLANALARLLGGVTAVPEETLLTEAMKSGVGEVTLDGLQDALEKGDYIRADVQGIPFVTTKEARARERRIVTAARNSDIELTRLKRGEAPPKDSEPLPGPDEIDRRVKEGERLHFWVKGMRDYRKPDRGNVAVVLEDFGHVYTGQDRPGLVQKVVKAGKAVAEKALKNWERVRRQAVLTQTQERRHGLGLGDVEKAGRAFER